MKEVKFLHCADIHLDMPFTSLGIEDNKPSIRRMDLKDTFQKIINMAHEEEVGLIFICGDLYEHDYIRRSTIDFINHAFKSIKDIKVFIVPGNHDPWVKGSYYMNYEWANNVNIISKDNPYVHLKEEGIDIYSYDAFLKEEIENGKTEFNPDNINILLAHGTVDLNIDGKSYNPMTSHELAALGMDYIALGHFHNRIDNIGGKGIIYNPGSPEPLGFDEPGEHGVYIGTIVKKGVNCLKRLKHSGESVNLDHSDCSRHLNIDFKSLNKRYYEELKVDITGYTTDEEVASNIMYGIKTLFPGLQSMETLEIVDSQDIFPVNNDLPDTTKQDASLLKLNLSSLLLSIILYGYIDPNYNIDMEYILSFLKDKVFYIKVRNEAVPEYDFDLIKKEPGLKGLFTGKMLELIDKAQNIREKELLKKSLYYGIQALEKGQVDVI
ncbi:MAG TPA: DNA repair exonuclease [Clostridiaceae bacterium]|nr:DNA repair exonuclease [Clostridiaceae bacterium]